MVLCGFGLSWGILARGDLWVLSSLSQYSKVLVILFLMRFVVIKKFKNELKVI